MSELENTHTRNRLKMGLDVGLEMEPSLYNSLYPLFLEDYRLPTRNGPKAAFGVGTGCSPKLGKGRLSKWSQLVVKELILPEAESRSPSTSETFR